MTHDASIHSYGCKPPITAGVLCETSCEEPETIFNSSWSQLESEPQRAMDQLLRECFTPKLAWQ